MSLPPPPLPTSADNQEKAASHRDRKPRIRHTEAQLVALNGLYDENEHPSLEDRAALADAIGMDPKAVNAWFANKRSATKKKSRGPPPSYSSSPQPVREDEDDGDGDALSQSANDLSRFSTPLGSLDYQPYHQPDSDNRHVFDSEISSGIPRRMRIRPTPKQTDELRKLYNSNTHPSREEREELGARIGMKYQSVTNWFQNQRSLARKRAEEEALASDLTSSHNSDFIEEPVPGPIHDSPPSSESRSFYPPATMHPSLASSLPQSRSQATRSYSDSTTSSNDSKQNVSRRASGGPSARPRRTRPEPHQLEALKKLFNKTPNPSIEERGALALAIDMDIAKVTNWFRNLRQTARKRALKANGDRDGDDYGVDFDDSAPASRMGTPSFRSVFSSHSSSVSADDDIERMDLDDDYGAARPHHHHAHSDVGSEEDYEEAVTPPPSVPRMTGRRRMDVGFLTSSSDDLLPHKRYATAAPAAPVVDPPRMEDALLLLSFSKHVVSHWCELLISV